MISTDKIKQLAVKYQASELNVLREYFQHLFLSYFYQEPKASEIYFKGGTAFRIIYKSPRFSEDLDFSTHKINLKNLENILLQTLDQIERENIKVTLKETKTTSGGYLANIIFEADGFQQVVIQIEISFRQSKLKEDITSISSDYIPSYIICGLEKEILVDEKIQALLFRRKPRDFYDLYFILRSNLLLPTKRKVLIEVLQLLKKTKINFDKELKIFLPKSQWLIIKDFKKNLEREINRFI